MKLKGIYHKEELYVFVVEKNLSDILKDQLEDTSWIGNNVDNARRKDIARRGPSDRRLILTCESIEKSLNQNVDNEKISQKSELSNSLLALSLNEAFLLSYHYKCLSIRNICFSYSHENSISKDVCQKHSSIQSLLMMESGLEQEYLTIEDCWMKFRNLYKESNLRIDFAVEFCVYHHYDRLGWVVKSGENYGTNFLLYERGPSQDHARYACIIMTDIASNSECLAANNVILDLDTIMAYNRLIQSVSKELIIAMVSFPSEMKSFDDPEACIKGVSIKTIKVLKHKDNLQTTC